MPVAYAVASPVVERYGSLRLLPAVLLVGASLNGLAVRVLEAWQLHGFEQPLMGVSPFELLAIFVGARALMQAAPASEPWFPVPEVALGAAMLFPSSTAAWFAIAAFGLLRARTAESERRTGLLVFVALAACSIWSSVLLKWWAGPASAFDAHAVYALLTRLRPDMAVTGNVVGVPNAHNLVILTACTSASGLPKALLGIGALTLLANGLDRRRMGLALVATLLLNPAVNLLRLSLMAWSSEFYLLIHGPVGANLFDLAQTAIVVGLGMWAARS